MKQSVRRPIDHDELFQILRTVLPKIRDRYGVCALGLFGSYARGQARSSSDVDLLVEFDRPPSLFRFIELEQELSDLLGVKVDLVRKTALKPAIEQQVLGEVRPV